LCRGDACTTYEAGHACTGFTFGARKPQRIYDKTAEMAAKGSDWWELVWGERHHEDGQVWRVEFQIGRAALSELDLFVPDAVLAAGPSLWRYYTHEWLTLRSPGADSNSSRWPVAPQWRAVQEASLAHGATELEWIRRHKRATSLRRLVPGLVGYLVSFAVLSGTTDIEDTVEALTARLADDEIARRVPFAERILRRRAEGGSDESSRRPTPSNPQPFLHVQTVRRAGRCQGTDHDVRCGAQSRYQRPPCSPSGGRAPYPDRQGGTVRPLRVPRARALDRWLSCWRVGRTPSGRPGYW
jgi:hypothetical protein